MKNIPELIVMLTHNDKTVLDAIEVFESSIDTKAKFWGFKEQPLPGDEMKKLVDMMKGAGKTTFLEVVEYGEKECLAGAQIAVDCGFDCLMGTLYFDSVLELTKSAGLKYMPFVGEVSGRPSVLGGTIEGMIEEANELLKKGVDGFDLLGYRFTGDAVLLNSEFVKNVPANVCLAGSVQSYERLDEVKATGAWSFTIGGAFFESKFGDDGFAAQIDRVIDYMNR